MVSLKLLTVLSSITACVLAQTKIRYMPFGDSITEIVCWRRYLYQHLQTAGITNVDFVGSLTTATTGCTGNDFDRNHEGHSGFQAVNIANANQLVGWLQSNPADIVTMHLGTNDINGGRSTTDITTAFSKLVDQMRASNPKMRIIVSLIPHPSIIDLSFLANTSRTGRPNNPIPPTICKGHGVEPGYSSLGD